MLSIAMYPVIQERASSEIIQRFDSSFQGSALEEAALMQSAFTVWWFMGVIRRGLSKPVHYLRNAPKSTIKKLAYFNIMVCVFVMYACPFPPLIIPVLLSTVFMGLALEMKGAAARGERGISSRAVFSFPLLVAELLLLEILAAIMLSFFLMIMFSLNRAASIILLGAVYIVVREALFAVRPLRRELFEGILLRDPVAAALITTALLVIDVWARFQYLLLINLYILTAVFSIQLLHSVIRNSIAGRKNLRARALLWICILVLSVTILHGTRHLSALGSFRPIPGQTRSELKYSPRAGINSDGFRGPQISPEKPAGTVRIAVMGDSATYGFLVSEDLTFCRILETLLRRNSSGAQYQVINGGVPSYNVAESLARFKEKTLGYDPDVVILFTGPNDAETAGRGLLSRQLADFLKETQEAGVELVICTYPSIWLAGDIMREVEDQTREFALSHNLPFIDVAGFTRGKYLHGTPDRHPNVRGHRAIAEFLYRELNAEDVI